MRTAVMVGFNRLRGYAKQGVVKLPIDRSVTSKPIERVLAKSGYERAEAKAARGLVRPGDTVLELGAGLGFLSACLRLETQVGRIVTYEANPDLVSYIARAHQENGVSNVDVRHGVVLAAPSAPTIPFHIRSNMRASSLCREDGAADSPVIRTVDVPVVAWPDIVAEVQPTALVVDIEGGELDLLVSCDLGPVRRMVVELHPALYGLAGMAQIYAALDRQGFTDNSGLSSGRVLALERA